ncbi:MAG: hypothetical protein HYY06_25210 [Deltaproteobacteria bacterium]|nr:hypothetical protein [Deltaproteobacteria bacterium]
MREVAFLVVALQGLLFACSPGDRGGGDADADSDADADADAECDDPDGDNDGIPDDIEGDGDLDGDGLPNSDDRDADGDSILDEIEAGDAGCSALRDSDQDGQLDAFDTDSDNDGLPDADEVRLGTNPGWADTDSDGFVDPVEVIAGTDPTDPDSRIPDDDYYVILPFGADPIQAPLAFGTDIHRADIFFLVDTSSSMGPSIDNIQQGLQGTIIPGISEQIEDVAFGVGEFEDFPVGSDGCSASDRPFTLHQEVTEDLDDVEDAVDRLDQPLGLGGCIIPEAHVEALYQTASGEGIGDWVEPEDCQDLDQLLVGMPCFREGALPIVLLISDAPMHNGPGGVYPWSDIDPEPHDWDDAVRALNDIGARVAGFAIEAAWGWDYYDGRPTHDITREHMEATAEATGTVVDGEPLVLDGPANGTGLSDSVVDAIVELAGGVVQDVDTVTEDDPSDDVDARRFIVSIVPASAAPDDHVSGMDETTFYDVVPGTIVTFTVTFQNDFVEPDDAAQIFHAVIVVRGNGVARLDERNVYVIVPSEDGELFI